MHIRGCFAALPPFVYKKKDRDIQQTRVVRTQQSALVARLPYNPSQGYTQPETVASVAVIDRHVRTRGSPGPGQTRLSLTVDTSHPCAEMGRSLKGAFSRREARLSDEWHESMDLAGLACNASQAPYHNRHHKKRFNALMLSTTRERTSTDIKRREREPPPPRSPVMS